MEMKQKWQRPLELQEYPEKMFLSVRILFTTGYSGLSRALTATKCYSQTHGYESTLKGVNKSLKKMKFGQYYLPIIDSTSIHASGC